MGYPCSLPSDKNRISPMVRQGCKGDPEVSIGLPHANEPINRAMYDAIGGLLDLSAECMGRIVA